MTFLRIWPFRFILKSKSVLIPVLQRPLLLFSSSFPFKESKTWTYMANIQQYYYYSPRLMINIACWLCKWWHSQIFIVLVITSNIYIKSRTLLQYIYIYKLYIFYPLEWLPIDPETRCQIFNISTRCSLTYINIYWHCLKNGFH